LDLNFWLGYASEWLGVIATVMLLGLNPIFRRPPVGFRYPRREGIVSLSLAFVIILTGAIFYNLAPNGPAFLSAFPGQLNGRVMAAVIAAVPVAVALYMRKQPLRSAGWRSDMTRSAVYVGLALSALTIFLRMRIFSLTNGITRAEGLSLLALLIVCLLEETVFRGYIQLRLTGWLGERDGWLITALIFVLWQAPAIRASGAALLPGLLLSLCQAVLYGWVGRKCNHPLATGLYRAVSDWMFFLV